MNLAAAADTDPNVPNWDPWWNNHLSNHATSVNAAGVTQYANIPSQYCASPAPGMKSWDSAANIWNTVIGGHTFGTSASKKPGNRYLRCDEPVVYSGPFGTTGPQKRDIGIRGRNATAAPELEELVQEAENQTTRANRAFAEFGSGPLESFDQKLVARAAAGSFLDARVYALSGCDNIDFDPCAWSEDCGEDTPDLSDDDSVPVVTVTAAPATSTVIITSTPTLVQSTIVITSTVLPATVQSTITSTSVITPTVTTSTTTAIVAPTVSANCDYWSVSSIFDIRILRANYTSAKQG